MAFLEKVVAPTKTLPPTLEGSVYGAVRGDMLSPEMTRKLGLGEKIDRGFLGKVNTPSEGFNVEKFVQLQREGEEARERARRMNSLPGRSWEFSKAFFPNLGKAIKEFAIGTIPESVLSVAEVPYTLATGRATGKEYDIPFVGPRKSFQTQQAEATAKVFDQEISPIRGMAPFAQATIAPLEFLAAGKGISMIPKTVKQAQTAKQGLTGVASNLYDAFFPRVSFKKPPTKGTEAVEDTLKVEDDMSDVIAGLESSRGKYNTREVMITLERRGFSKAKIEKIMGRLTENVQDTKYSEAEITEAIGDIKPLNKNRPIPPKGGVSEIHEVARTGSKVGTVGDDVVGAGTAYTGQAKGAQATTGDRFLTQNKETARRAGNITGKKGLEEEDISGLRFKRVDQGDFVSARQDPNLRDTHDGIVFRDKRTGEDTFFQFRGRYVPPGQERFTAKTGEEIKEHLLTQKLVDEAEELGLPTMSRMRLSEQGRVAEELIASDPDKALDIAMGRTEAPEDLQPGSVFVALREQAMKNNDVDLLRELSRSTISTETAQALKAFDSYDPDDPIKIIRQVEKAREARNKNHKKDVAKTVDDIKKEINKKTTKRETWNEFVNNLKCNY